MGDYIHGAVVKQNCFLTHLLQNALPCAVQAMFCGAAVEGSDVMSKHKSYSPVVLPTAENMCVPSSQG
jgi:hypothetical protein